MSITQNGFTEEEMDSVQSELSISLAQNAQLRAALEELCIECQESRRWIVLNDDGGFASYKATAEAIDQARAALATA
jgi:hypothetical protein